MLILANIGVEIGEYRQWQYCLIGLRAGNLFHYLGEVDNELSEAAGIPGCVFVPLSGFIGENLELL